MMATNCLREIVTVFPGFSELRDSEGHPLNFQNGLEPLIRLSQQWEQQGYDSVLIPVGTGLPDPWIVASVISQHTQKLRLLLALRPGFIAPAVAARMGTTLDYFSQGRVALNIVTGSALNQMQQDGDFHEHSMRYQRTEEFLTVVRGVWTHRRFPYSGKFYQLQQTFDNDQPLQRPHPPIYFGGASEQAKHIAAQQADVYMMWAEPLDKIRARIAEIRELAARYKREPGFSISFRILARDTAEEAWEAAQQALQGFSQQDKERTEKYYLSVTESVGQKRILAFEHDKDGWVDKNLWAGLTCAIWSHSLLLLGSVDEVAKRLNDYLDLGISTLLLRGHAFMQDGDVIATKLLPRLRERLIQAQVR
ncbi:LLM class flavin-dependent oxidoreductase [Ktedonosporobacter rubrisoli]|nr:LLM class flavin-dependent oxidoreductase [Ktedonosporobacter rubrisoli]